MIFYTFQLFYQMIKEGHKTYRLKNIQTFLKNLEGPDLCFKAILKVLNAKKFCQDPIDHDILHNYTNLEVNTNVFLHLSRNMNSDSLIEALAIVAC